MGVSIADSAFRRDWIRRRLQGRSAAIRTDGIAAFSDLFGVDI
jgi:hypothetical protein